MATSFRPTQEQVAAIEAFESGSDMVLEAGAGTGKTATLKLMAAARPNLRGVYVAYNSSIAKDAQASFPKGVDCRTAHSFAYRWTAQAWGRNALQKRLNGPRIPAMQAARILGAKDVLRLGPDRMVTSQQLARIALETAGRFCTSADLEVSPWHIPRVNGIDEKPDRAALVRTVLPLARKAWADLSEPVGELKFTHDCQPPGTLVRRAVRRGGHFGGATEEVPIESVREGDYVVSFDARVRRGYVRRQGRRVTAVGFRDYVGDLVTVMTSRGRQSSYTTEHRCVVRLDCDLADGNYIVYLARRGNDFRIGRTTWRTRTQGNALGIRRRAESQGADAVWILSAHPTDEAAALQEALAAHQWRIPTWQFRAKNERMPLEQYWSKVGNNSADARACLSAHGLQLDHPFWQLGDGWETTRRPVVMRALNLMSGMLVLEPDHIRPNARGALLAHDGSEGWAPITVKRSPYEGPVYNLDVDVDHTYVADGIVTHNCYLKIWALSDPVLPADYVLLDEAQDSAPVVAKVFNQQTGAQRVAVGDACQAIYGWRGATDAMAGMTVDERLYLTQSFRFGAAVAEEANKWLELLNASLRLKGTPAIASRLRPLSQAAAVLCRSNAEAVARLMKYHEAGVPAAVVGGGQDVKRLAEAAIELQAKGRTSHPELCVFTSWGMVQEYVEHDHGGQDLKVAVKLIDTYGADEIIDAIERSVPENRARVVLSTAHKAKGREWDTVQIATDFHKPAPDEDGRQVEPAREESMLAYVAVSRAKLELDRAGLAWIDDYSGSDRLEEVGR